MKSPAYKLTIEGIEAGADLRRRFVSLSLTDEKGLDSDALEIQLSDTDGLIAMPRHGAKVRLWLGWHGEPLVDKGLFVVDEVEHSGPPDQLSIRAKAAELRGTLKEQRTRGWDMVHLGDIIETIAGAHGLTPSVATDLAGIVIDHIDQTDESDVHFLTRLGREHDAIATIKDGHLLFARAGEGKTASGQALPGIVITRRDGDRHRYTVQDRAGTTTGVKAKWTDREAAWEKEVLVGEEGNVKTLRKVYPNEAAAEAAAEAEYKRGARSAQTMSLTLAFGRPELLAETPVTLSGFKPGIDGSGWIAARVTHRLDDTGMTTDVELDPVNGKSDESDSDA